MADVEDLQEVSIPKNRTDILKWNGWGYKDTQFELGEWRSGSLKWADTDNKTRCYAEAHSWIVFYSSTGEDGKGTLTGDRYELSGKTLPAMKDWMVKQFDIDLSKTTTAQPRMKDVPSPTLNEPFLDAIKWWGGYRPSNFTPFLHVLVHVFRFISRRDARHYHIHRHY